METKSSQINSVNFATKLSIFQGFLVVRIVDKGVEHVISCVEYFHILVFLVFFFGLRICKHFSLVCALRSSRNYCYGSFQCSNTAIVLSKCKCRLMCNLTCFVCYKSIFRKFLDIKIKFIPLPADPEKHS